MNVRVHLHGGAVASRRRRFPFRDSHRALLLQQRHSIRERRHFLLLFESFVQLLLCVLDTRAFLLNVL